jgi:hypothetical protein
MGDLQHVDLGKPARDEGRVDALLDVPGEQEPPPVDFAEEND